ncbi:MAG: phosphoglycerate kinase [Bacteroidia bacterium]
MKTIDTFNFSGKRALVRVDFNVPLDAHFHITDDTRIRAAIPTIKKILHDGGSVILMSHLGRPKDVPEEKFSLKHIVAHIYELLGIPVKFANNCLGANTKKMAQELKSGEVLLLENLRFYKQEQAGTESFAQELASYGDVYVNDAFGTAHRAHASTAVIAKFFTHKMFGYVMASELTSINKVLNNAERPLTAIIGGAKVSGKILIITKLLDKIDHLIIGGGMAYTFVKAQGGRVGNSLVEDDKLDIAKNILAEAKKKNVHIHIPEDTIIADSFSNEAMTKQCDIKNIPDGWLGLDIGSETIKKYNEIIAQSKTILWNGPMGVFEMTNFEKGTKAIAEAIVKATKNGAYSLIGGGDSVAAINKYKMGTSVSYVSTGGGALLEYIESGTLPGVSAIEA